MGLHTGPMPLSSHCLRARLTARSQSPGPPWEGPRRGAPGNRLRAAPASRTCEPRRDRRASGAIGAALISSIEADSATEHLRRRPLHVQDNRIVKVTSPLDHDVGHGHLCVKGRFGFEFVQRRARES
jgi:hypothetical protein